MENPAHQEIIEQTRQWIQSFVIGLNLCPFAKQAFDTDRIRFLVSEASDPQKLLDDFIDELLYLNKTDPKQTETTILIHPYTLTDFLQYNDFLDVVDNAITTHGMEEIIQVASFHPDYRFTGTHPDAVENHTNRSPYPMLHLLRDSSITRAMEEHPDVNIIPGRNIDTLRDLGLDKVKKIGKSENRE